MVKLIIRYYMLLYYYYIPVCDRFEIRSNYKIYYCSTLFFAKLYLVGNKNSYNRNYYYTFEMVIVKLINNYLVLEYCKYSDRPLTTDEDRSSNAYGIQTRVRVNNVNYIPAYSNISNTINIYADCYNIFYTCN